MSSEHDEKRDQDVVTVPAWARTVILSVMAGVLPGLTIWAINMEYRVRLSETRISEMQSQEEMLQTIQTDLAVLKVQLADLRKLVEERNRSDHSP